MEHGPKTVQTEAAPEAEHDNQEDGPEQQLGWLAAGVLQRALTVDCCIPVVGQ